MSLPVSMQHILTNSSAAEKTQQSNHIQTDGQQKHLATRLQKEKGMQKQKILPTAKSDMLKISKENEKQNKQKSPQQQKIQDKSLKGDAPKEESDDGRQQETPRIDILV